MKASVTWTERALSDLQGIHLYLFKHFDASIILRVDRDLLAFEQQVHLYPKMYPKDRQLPHLRRAVLNPFMVVFYRVEPDQIVAIRVFASRALQ